MKITVQNLYNPSTDKTMRVKSVSGTKEWASQTVNLFSGCEYDCKYCYAKSMAIRYKRKTADNWSDEAVDCRLLHVVPKPSKDGGSTMFPSAHDITPKNFGYSVFTIGLLLDAGHPLLLVTKPHWFVISEIDGIFSDKKNQILFRFTIGSMDTKTLKFWEPNAPTFQERLMALQFAYLAGYKTSISCEPALDTNTAELIEVLLPYVTDAIWIGLPNRLKATLKLNGADDQETLTRAEALIKGQSDEWVFDLYNLYKDNPKVKWKDSIKKIVGLPLPTKAGLDE